MWVEIFPTNKASQESDSWDITPRPVKDFEVRLVVWDTKDVIAADWEGTSDVFIRAFFDSRQAKETDTHYRCSNGKASFNYRLLFNMKAPADHYNLTIQAWDRDFFASNDLIGDANFDLKYIFEDVVETGRSLALNKKYYTSYLKSKLPPDYKLEFEDDDSFWVPCKGRDEKTREFKNNGFVRISVTVLPKEQAEANKVGEARTEPNHSPYLPAPTGRLSLSLNPFSMLS
jgi:Ca2+-dependent lipid-binding protein